MDIRRHCENGTPIMYRESKKGFSVHYSGRVIGHIVPALGGFQYVTREGDRGEVFPLVRDVMHSLEEC